MISLGKLKQYFTYFIFYFLHYNIYHIILYIICYIMLVTPDLYLPV